MLQLLQKYFWQSVQYFLAAKFAESSCAHISHTKCFGLSFFDIASKTSFNWLIRKSTGNPVTPSFVMFVGVLHVGHRNWDLVLPFESCDILTCCCKHVSQNECRHGRALGDFNLSRHILHCNSWSVKAEAIFVKLLG
jgi:hypothetical protein